LLQERVVMARRETPKREFKIRFMAIGFLKATYIPVMGKIILFKPVGRKMDVRHFFDAVR
jgi:hypothetical protein